MPNIMVDPSGESFNSSLLIPIPEKHLINFFCLLIFTFPVTFLILSLIFLYYTKRCRGINPHLTRLFFVTRLTKGGVIIPINLKNKSIHKKSTNTPCMTSQWCYNCAQFGNFQWNIGQNWIFHKKSSKYQNFSGFFACKRRKQCF